MMILQSELEMLGGTGCMLFKGTVMAFKLCGGHNKNHGNCDQYRLCPGQNLNWYI